MPSRPQYILKVPDEIAALVRGLHPQVKVTIRSALHTILHDPHIGKPLRDELAGLRSYRAKRYRIIYRLSPNKKYLEIIAIGPRKNIYEETFRIVSREAKEK
jgi:mRNA interferase RelE/StbE